ncbi:rodlin [Streptomyces sp. GC420]|uniref:rodlin n=1 Tax=Streptomyces sp. GC420 TaxID=2697568 RepID=UPI00141518B4|nr:rodlin [Streptomyces sp. GC420]NBM19656.1 RdlA protein [Streptomyces sp. GC420]
MIKKIMASAAVAASVVGASAAAASPAMAIANDTGTTSASGNGATSLYGNSKTAGDLSPQLGLVQGSLNKPCVAVGKVNLGEAAGLDLLPATLLQDVQLLSGPQNQQCAENSTQAKGDEPLSHILDDIDLLSGNGSING